MSNTFDDDKIKRDADLLIEILELKSQAFQLFFDQNYEKIEKVVYAIVKNTQEAQDITQEAFSRLLIKIAEEMEFKSLSDLAGYLYVTAMRLAYDYYNKQKDMVKVLKEYKEWEEGNDTIDANDMGTLVWTVEMYQKIEAAVQTLTPEHQEIVRQFYWGGKTLVEIAEYLEMPYENVKKIKSRSDKKMAKVLRKSFYLIVVIKVLVYAYKEISQLF